MTSALSERLGGGHLVEGLVALALPQDGLLRDEDGDVEVVEVVVDPGQVLVAGDVGRVTCEGLSDVEDGLLEAGDAFFGDLEVGARRLAVLVDAGGQALLVGRADDLLAFEAVDHPEVEVGLDVKGVGAVLPDEALEELFGLLGVALLAIVDHGEVDVGLAHLGAILDGLLVGLDRAVDVALLLAQQPEVKPRLTEAWVDLDRLFELGG